MNNDIEFKQGKDLTVIKSDIYRAANILRTQLRSLEYAPTIGIDMKYFLESEFAIQNESFRAYTVQRLMECQVNVMNAVSTINNLFQNIDYLIDDNNKVGTGLIA